MLLVNDQKIFGPQAQSTVRTKQTSRSCGPENETASPVPAAIWPILTLIFSYHIIANAATAPRAHPLFKAQPLFTVIAGPPAVLQVQKPVVWLPIQLVPDAIPVTGAPVTAMAVAALVVAGTVVTAVTWVLKGSVVVVSVVVATVITGSPPVFIVELPMPMATSLRGIMTVTYDSLRLEKVKVLVWDSVQEPVQYSRQTAEAVLSREQARAAVLG
jgi:hypothetical protein